MFALEVGEAATGRSGDGAVVTRVSDIIPAKPEDNKQEYEQLSGELGEQLRRDIYAEFLLALGKTVEVERNNEVVKQMIAAEQ